MPTCWNRHPHDLAAMLGQGAVSGMVGWRTGVWLHVRVLGPKKRLRPLDRQQLDLVDDLIALVIAGPGVPLAILIREDGSGCLEDGELGKIFRRNHLERGRLHEHLLVKHGREFGIHFAQVWVAISKHGSESLRRYSRALVQDNGLVENRQPLQGFDDQGTRFVGDSLYSPTPEE